MLQKNQILPVLLLLGSLALLIPGVTQPMLTITGTMDKSQLKDTGIDILVDSMVDDKEVGNNNDPNQHQAAKQRIKSMITGVTRMLGMSEVSGQIEAYQKTRSISGTVSDLYHSGDILVAFLVMLFSIVIPTTKILMLLISTVFSHSTWRNKVLMINSLLSKWSMADVFVVALIVTYMAANASGGTGLLTFQSQFENGFFFFLAYCIFSITAAQWVSVKNRTQPHFRVGN